MTSYSILWFWWLHNSDLFLTVYGCCSKAGDLYCGWSGTNLQRPRPVGLSRGIPKVWINKLVCFWNILWNHYSIGGGGAMFLDFWIVLTHDSMSPTPMILCPPPKVFNQKYYETNKISIPMKKKKNSGIHKQWKWFLKYW